MRPKPRWAIPGTNAAHSWKAASTFTAWIRRQVSRLTSPNGRKSIRPAQLTSTSHRPRRPVTLRTSSATPPGEPRSHSTANASPPASPAPFMALIAVTVSSAGCRSPRASVWPAWASRNAMAWPIPRAAPVTTATRPSASIMALASRNVEAERGEHDVRDPVGHLVLRKPDIGADQVVNPLEHHQAGHRGELGVLLVLAGRLRGGGHARGHRLGNAEEQPQSVAEHLLGHQVGLAEDADHGGVCRVSTEELADPLAQDGEPGGVVGD